MKKRFLSLLLVLSMLFAVAAPLSVGAADSAVPETASGGMSNPLYEGGLEQHLSQAETKEAAAEQKAASYVSPETAAQQLRDAMVRRESSVTLYIAVPNFWYTNGSSNWFNDTLFAMALSMEYAVGPTDGDYLMWSWGTQQWDYQRSGNNYTFHVYISYYTTYAQEQETLTRLNQIIASLNLAGKSDYDKYTAIYDYVAGNVTYDYDGLEAFANAIENGTLSR